MPLCPQVRSCGCSITSASFNISGDGSSVNPWKIEDPGVSQSLKEFSVADLGERNAEIPVPGDGQRVWVRSLQETHRWVQGRWVIWEKGSTAFTPTLGDTSGVISWGNALKSASYSVAAGLCHYAGSVVLGSSTNMGTVATQFDVTTPIDPVNVYPIVGQTRRSGAAWFIRNVNNVVYPAQANVVGTLVRFLNVEGSKATPGNYQIIGNSRPFVWAQDDEFVWTVTYPTW